MFLMILWLGYAVAIDSEKNSMNEMTSDRNSMTYLGSGHPSVVDVGNQI
jgi:hypothetical protein